MLPDILINNAGITDDKLFLKMSDENWDNVINTNLTGTFNLTKVFIKNMIKKRYGSIINISSVSGLMGNPGQVNYSSSKSALNGFTKSLAKELGSRNITVNSVAPGFISTDMTTFLDNNKKDEIIIGTRHSEKFYETLISREEMARVEDRGKYFKVPPDNRGLDYDNYFIKGKAILSDSLEYTSHNTKRLKINEIIEILLKNNIESLRNPY